MAEHPQRSPHDRDPAGLSPGPRWAPIAALGYLGGPAVLLASALRASARTRGASRPFVVEVIRQVDRLLALAWIPTAIVHVGMGSFLAMQAYFGATFVDGIGPVVGVGLIRNLAPLLSGFLLAGLVAPTFVSDLRHEPDSESDESPDPARRSAVRVAATMIAGPVLATWGALVGVVVGFATGRSMMGVSVPGFFDLFLEMLWARDVVGLVVKGAGFGLASAALACHEGVKAAHAGGRTCRRATRAASLAGLAILFLNAGWFLLVYHAGPPFGPTVLTPPGS